MLEISHHLVAEISDREILRLCLLRHHLTEVTQTQHIAMIGWAVVIFADQRGDACIVLLKDLKEETLTAVFTQQELLNNKWIHITVFGKEVLMSLTCLASQIVEVAIYLQCHSGLARSTASTLALLLNRHSALCTEFGVSAIYGDTHHNRCFATFAKSGAANEDVY